MVKILSYNVFFKAMQIPANLKNVSNFIEKYGPYDFVGLQEATNWSIIQKNTPVLRKMTAIAYKEDFDEIVTFYDTYKYQLDDNENKLFGHMADINRPISILFFRDNLCIINLHAGHYSLDKNGNKIKDIYKLNYYIKRILSKNKHKDKFMEKLQSYDIIMMGDFNDKLADINFNLLGRQLYGINKNVTCCTSNLALNQHRLISDHILSTFPNNKTIVIPNLDASDHAPIISTLRKNIGYDFDGVLHMSVTAPDQEGQRHPLSINGPYQIFNEIIDKIIRDIHNGNQIFIITARTKSKTSINAINDHIKSSKLYPYRDQITILFSAGQPKINLLNEYGINTFYDDSCLRIKELYHAKLNNQLPLLTQIYFVNPDYHSYQLVTKNNNYCYEKIKENVEICINTINQLIINHDYRFKNPEINILLGQLKNGIENNSISIKECSKLQNDIIRLINVELNQEKN